VEGVTSTNCPKARRTANKDKQIKNTELMTENTHTSGEQEDKKTNKYDGDLFLLYYQKENIKKRDEKVI
jgi:hypothetical protein